MWLPFAILTLYHQRFDEEQVPFVDSDMPAACQACLLSFTPTARWAEPPATPLGDAALGAQHCRG